MKTPELTSSNKVYEMNGYDNRKEYLEELAIEYGVEYRHVLELATLLGPDEDFDGLVATVQDVAYYFHRK